MGWLEDMLGYGQSEPPRDHLDEFAAGRAPDPDPDRALALLGYSVPQQAPVQEPPPPPQVLRPVQQPFLSTRTELADATDRPDMTNLSMLDQPVNPKAAAYERQQAEAAQTEARAITDMVAAKAAKEREVAERSALEAHRSLTEQQRIEEERQQGAADIDRRQREIYTEAEEASKREADPNRVFKNASTGEAIGMAVMGALAGFLDQQDPKHGGHLDRVLGFIDKKVQTDIDLQLRAIEQKNKALGFKQAGLTTEASRQQQNLDNRLRAETMAFAATMKIIEAEAARLDSPYAAAEARKLLAGIQMRQSDKAQAYRDQQEGLRLQRSSVGVQWFNAKENKRQFDEKMAFERDQAIKKGDYAKVENLQKFRELAIPGVIDPRTGSEFMAPTGPEATKARESMAVLAEVNDLLGQRQALRDEFNSETMPSQAKDRMKTIDQKLKLMVKSGENLGTLDKGSEAFLEGYIGDSTRWSNISAQTDQVRKNFTNQMQAKLVSMGFKGEVAPLALRETGLKPRGLVGTEPEPAGHWDPVTKQFVRDLPAGGRPAWSGLTTTPSPYGDR